MYSENYIKNKNDIVYIYDGSLQGLYCCVYESVYKKELPFAIFTNANYQPSLIKEKHINTNYVKGKKVEASIPIKISNKALRLIKKVFLSCAKDKELKILNFLLFAYKMGSKSTNMINHPIVSPLIKAKTYFNSETENFSGFTRFSDYEGVLCATIEPNNFVLPYLIKHFICRFPKENFIIYDKTHMAALIYKDGKASIEAVDNIEFPKADEEEKEYRELWKKFYNSVSIKSRENHKCRMTHMPKRYWKNMIEVKDNI